MNKTICVIGAGYWGKNHIRVLNDLGVLGGIVEEDTAVIKEVSRNYPKIKFYNKVESALTEDNFDGFTVATPSETHYKLAKKS